MKCFVLAAGYATRLYPLTENFPKPLLPVAWRTILDRALDGLEMDVVVISNHRFLSHFEAWARGKNVTVLDDGSTDNAHRLGAVRDIEFALEKTGASDDVLVIAGDNLLTFPLSSFVSFAREKGTSCVMCHEEHDLKKLQKTAVITVRDDGLITSYEEKPMAPRGHLAVPPFYYYRAEDVRRIPEALAEGCGYDAPGSFAAWLSGKTAMHAWTMPGPRYDIGDIASYTEARRLFGESI